MWVESSYSTLDVTQQDSPVRHYAEPPGPARTLLDNYYSALTADLPEALHSSSALFFPPRVRSAVFLIAGVWSKMRSKCPKAQFYFFMLVIYARTKTSVLSPSEVGVQHRLSVEGANNGFSNQYWISGFMENTLDKLYGAIYIPPSHLLFRGMLKHCFAVKLKKCFVNISQLFPSTWGRASVYFWVTLSFNPIMYRHAHILGITRLQVLPLTCRTTSSSQVWPV